MKLFDCDRCENGIISRYGHINNGICYKCNGTGKLNYDPMVKSEFDPNMEWNEQDKLEIEREQEMIRQAEFENWKIANNIDIEDDYY